MDLSDLTVLDLSGNPGISFIPNDIDMLQNLKTFRFCGNGVSTLPIALLKLRSLTSLELNQNGISDFFETDSRTGAPINPGEVELHNLTYLSLNRNNLTKIPSICKHLPAL